MASEGLFSGCWTPATLRTFQVPLRASQLKVKAFYTRVGALADLKISKACRNIYRRIFSGGVIAWHGRNDLRDTTGLPFAKLTRIDIPVRSNVFRGNGQQVRAVSAFGRGCGQECPRAAKHIPHHANAKLTSGSSAVSTASKVHPSMEEFSPWADPASA